MSRASLKKLAAILFVFLACLIPVMEAVILAPDDTSQSRGTPLGPGLSPDFTISSSPASLTLASGSSGSTIISLHSVGGFAGTILLSTPPFPLDSSLDKQSVTLTSGSTATATLTVVVPADTSPDNYAITVSGIAGCSTLHTKDVTVTVTGPEFSITLSKPSLSTLPGGYNYTIITLTSKNGFSGLVDLFAFGSGGVSTFLSLTPVPLSSGGTLSSNLTIFVPLTTLPGNYSLEVDASSGSLVQFLDLVVTVNGPGFTALANPLVLEVLPGGSNSSTITLTPFGGFVGTVSLLNDSFPAGLEAIFTPPSLTLPGSTTSTLSVSVPPGPTTEYTLIVTAFNPTYNATVALSVLVKEPDFTVSTSPSEISLNVGGSPCTSIATVTALFGFTGPVTLLNSTSPSGLNVSISATTITTAGSATITVSAPATAVPGSYYILIAANSTATTHYGSVTVDVTGPDFKLSASPTSLTVTAPATGTTNVTSTISIASLDGFTDTVTVAAFLSGVNMTASVNPVVATSPGLSILTVGVGSSAESGVYTAYIVGVSGPLSHTATVDVTVIAPDFSINAGPNLLTFNTTSVASSTVTIAALNGFTGSVDLSVFTSSGLNASISPTSVNAPGTATLSFNSTVPGTYIVEIDGSSGFLTHYAFVSVTVTGPDFSINSTPSSLIILAGSNANSTITFTDLEGFSGNINLTVLTPLGLTASLNASLITPSTTAKLTITVAPDTQAGTYYVDLVGTSDALTHTAIVKVRVSDFTVTASPTSVSSIVGASASSTITLARAISFTGTVALTYSSSPSGLACTLTPSSLVGTSQTSALSCSGSIGVYTVTVTGTSGSRAFTATVTVTVGDFSVTASPATKSVATGSSATSTITVGFLNGFTDTVSLTETTSPSTGITCSLTSSSFTSSGTSTLSCIPSATGTFTVTLTGSSGSLSHTTTFIITSSVPNFTMTANPTTLTIQAGSSGTSTITVAPVNGFTGVVTLSATSSPTGPTNSFSTTSISGGSGSSTLTINVDGSITPATYTITVQGTSGSLSNTAQVTLTVTAASTGSNILGIPSTTFYGIIIVIVIAAVGVVLYFMRFRKKAP